MTDKEKEVYMRYCKYDKEPKEVIMNLVSVIEKQQAEIETLKRDFEIVDHECSRLEQEDIKKDKIINELKAENHELKEKLQMFIPRRRVRRINSTILLHFLLFLVFIYYLKSW